MTIDSTVVLTDISILLPANNLLTDQQMLNIIERIITSVGSDDKYYGEVCCKSLSAIADINLARVAVDVGNLKREKVGDHEEEYHSSSNSNGSWKDFKDSLKTLCPIMWSYSVKTAGRIYMNVGEDQNPLDPNRVL